MRIRHDIVFELYVKYNNLTQLVDQYTNKSNNSLGLFFAFAFDETTEGWDFWREHAEKQHRASSICKLLNNLNIINTNRNDTNV